MLQKLQNWLRQPFMAYTVGWHNLPLIVGSAIFIFLFLFVFEPFQIYTITNPTYKLQLILGFTIVPPLCVIFMIEVLGRIFPKVYHEKGWTVGSEIFFVMSLIFLIAIGNFLNSVLQHSDKIPATPRGFFKMLFYTTFISFFPAVAFVWFRYYNLNKHYQKEVKIVEVEKTIPQELAKETQLAQAILTLVAENGKDKIVIQPQHLCYIEADDNYVTVVYQESGGKIKKG